MQRTQEGDEDFQCRVPSNRKLEIQLETNRCVSWFAFKWGELACASWGGLSPLGLQGRGEQGVSSECFCAVGCAGERKCPLRAAGVSLPAAGAAPGWRCGAGAAELLPQAPVLGVAFRQVLAKIMGDF